MRELTRTNDPVFLSYLSAELKSEGIEPLVLDAFASTMLAPMNATALQRVMVDEDDYWQAWAVLEEAEERVTEDSLLDGRLILLQPKDGFRASIDPVFLAACVPAKTGDRILDVGTGTGAAALSLLVRQPWAWVTGIDIQDKVIALAQRTAARNKLDERAKFIVADIASDKIREFVGEHDHVMSNPPFFAAGSGQVPKSRSRALATVESTADLATWIEFMTGALRTGGTATLVHRAEREDEIFDLLGRDCGDFHLLELFPREQDESGKLIVVQATKGGGNEQITRAELVLHKSDGDFTDEAMAILRDASSAPMSGP